jgi:hypothetical protein
MSDPDDDDSLRVRGICRHKELGTPSKHFHLCIQAPQSHASIIQHFAQAS